jgi:hypothetical protein
MNEATHLTNRERKPLQESYCFLLPILREEKYLIHFSFKKKKHFTREISKMYIKHDCRKKIKNVLSAKNI